MQHNVQKVQPFEHPGEGRRRAKSTPKGRQIDPQAAEEIEVLLGDSSRQRDLLIEHLEALYEFYGEATGVRVARKHAAWYTKGFKGSARLRQRLTRAETFAELAGLLEDVDGDEPFPAHALRVPRGKSGGRQRVALPDGYLDELDDATPPPAEAEDPASGG